MIGKIILIKASAIRQALDAALINLEIYKLNRLILYKQINKLYIVKPLKLNIILI